MTILYRLLKNEAGTSYRESHDLDSLIAYRTSEGKTETEWPILVFDLKFEITNDPESRSFDSIDDAQHQCEILKMDTFYVAAAKTPVSV